MQTVYYDVSLQIVYYDVSLQTLAFCIYRFLYKLQFNVTFNLAGYSWHYLLCQVAHLQEYCLDLAT